MNQSEPLKNEKPSGTLERLLSKAEIDLARNRKTQEQLTLAFLSLKANFKTLKQEKIIIIDIYKNLLYNIDNTLKLIRDYKLEEFQHLKKIKEIKSQIQHYQKPVVPEPKKPKPKIYEFARYKKQD